MDKSSEFVSQITNFPVLSPEENETGVSVLLSKLFKFGRSSGDSNVVTTPPEVQEEKQVEEEFVKENSVNTDVGNTSQYSDDLSDGRSLQKVLKRISSLVALRTSTGTRYADTEQARYWMPDNVSRECYECGIRFSAFRRRHHCRVCGQIFCARCCSHRVPGHVCGCAGGLRVCTYCCRIVLSYLQSVDSGTVLSADLKALQENLKEKNLKDDLPIPDQGFLLGGNSGESVKEGSVVGDGNSEHGFLRPVSLQDTYRHLCLSLPLQLQRYRLIRYTGVWRGGDILQWLIEHGNIPTRVQASDLCQSLMKEGLIECVTEHQTFTDYALYRPINPPILAAPDLDENIMTGSTSSYCLNLNLTENSAHLVRGQRTDNNHEIIGESDSQVPSQSDGNEDSKSCCESVEASGLEHLRLLLAQGLTRESLNLAWAPILLPLCQQVANMIIPDTTCPEWDIRRCVRVKRVAGGLMRESYAVGGIVFSKNIAHKGMPTSLTSPRILLLRCSLVYQRVEGKLISLEPVIMQEQEYLRNCCARILALKPDVVIVQGSVSRTAQEELLNYGKVLVIGVRAPTLQRLARCTHADILTSVDARVGAPRLGTCKAFYMKNFESKTLMVIEGHDNDLRGCSIILRGAPLDELARVKKVISLVLLAAYNWRLESSLLKDMGATLPVSSASLMFIDNSKDNSPEKDRNTNEETPEYLNEFLDINISEVDTNSKNEEQLGAIDDSNDLSKESKLSIAVTDPLTMTPVNSNKKNDIDKGPALSCGIAVDDFSDPLRSRRISIDDDVFLPQQATIPEMAQYDSHSDTLRNRWSVDETVLSMSPHVRICAPYLESELGQQCSLRHYFCSPLFHTPVPVAPPTPRANHRLKKQNTKIEPSTLYAKEAHKFVTKPLIQTVDGIETRSLLANYRATGGRLLSGNITTKPICVNNIENKIETMDVVKNISNKPDPLDPEEHQRMCLLFYSYSPRSTNAPDFCINPSIVCMEMYGLNDISLGQFLERHCFAQQFTCPSTTCQIPLMQHVRKFVHGDGCVTVTCVSVDNSSTVGNQAKILVDDEGKQSIMWWCRCMGCGEKGGGGGSSCLRPVSLAISLAKYLELRLHAPRYTRNCTCHHSLNQHYAHYFACGNITACFRYNKIKSWDICLPASSITTHYNTRAMREFLINQVNEFALKGHDFFSHIGENEQEKEQAIFKQHIDQIQVNLTSSILQEQTSGAGIVRWLWSISDALVNGEKLLRDCIEKWTVQTNPKGSFRITQENIIDGKIESDDSSQADYSTVECVPDKSLSGNSYEIENQSEEEDKTDRRGLRTILSQLLNNSQPANQNGIVFCGGLVPVIVMAGEISSVVAAALASSQYHQQLHVLSQTKGVHVDLEEKDSSNNKEKSENDNKSKNAPIEHIDVQLRDGLFCRIYYPYRFLKLRSLLICPLQSNNNIFNDFELKPNEQLDVKNKDETSSMHSDYFPLQKDEAEHYQVSTSERDSSVEASPVLGMKKSSEDKLKRIGKDSHSKLLNAESFNGIEEAFIRSLTRCVPWAARGGKSGSTFCKTKDDRYILKEMSKLELQLFVDLAPHYFNYIQSCLQNNYPTLLGRIVGVYRVSGVEGVGGGVLVMENLWHGRAELAHRFDLKGAQRNRLAEQGPPDVVLLDENLLNLRWESPIYLQSHSAGVLWAAVERDTKFLSSHHVMDYSLLVGLDEERHELVLGIIDYIRTFTWDKKLEHIVKKGLGSGLPTIVSPEQYKARFCNAMKKYFLQSPNQWEDLDKGLICNIPPTS